MNWIKVAYRLPPQNKDVLLILNNGQYALGQLREDFKPEIDPDRFFLEWHIDQRILEINEVQYWMPLPDEPSKECKESSYCFNNRCKNHDCCKVCVMFSDLYYEMMTDFPTYSSILDSLRILWYKQESICDNKSIIDPYNLPRDTWLEFEDDYKTYLKCSIWVTDGENVERRNCFKEVPQKCQLNKSGKMATHWIFPSEIIDDLMTHPLPPKPEEEK
jgi:hypothetical protein